MQLDSTKIFYPKSETLILSILFHFVFPKNIPLDKKNAISTIMPKIYDLKSEKLLHNVRRKFEKLGYFSEKNFRRSFHVDTWNAVLTSSSQILPLEGQRGLKIELLTIFFPKNPLDL